MTLFGLQIPDVLTLAAYLVGITVLGVWMSRTIHDTTDFFVGGRRFGRLLSAFFAFGTGTHSDQAVSVAAKTYTSGMSGIWYQWLWLFVTPFYWLIAPMQRRCRAITTGDYFEARYARSVAMLFVVIGILNLMVNIGTMLKGSGAVIRATTGDELSEDWAIVAMTVLFVTYGVAGGLAAAVVTDFVQGLLTILFSFMLLPLAIYHLGGLAALHQKVAETFAAHPAPGVSTYEAMWSLAPGGGGASEITLFYVVIIMLNGLVGIVAQPHSLPSANASRTEREAQFGVVTGNLIKRVCTVAWCLLGMCAFVMFPGMTQKENIDQAFGLIAHELLPMIAPGLIGVFIASLLASIMSSCDAFMITCSGLFTHNLYRPLTGGARSEQHYVNVGRLVSALIVAGGVFFAFTFESVLQGLELFWKISALMGIAFWAGLFWRRATTAGAWAGTLLAFAVVVFTSDSFIWSFNEHFAGSLPEWMLWDGKLWLPWQMIAYLTVGVFGLVVVSLFTRPPDARQLDQFYTVVRTPTRAGEVVPAPFTLPEGTEPAPQNKLIDHPDWEIQTPSRRSVVGFLVVVAIALAMMALTLLIVKIGRVHA
jgi:Na+/proline symporter